jgi:hypothetical protein
MRSSPSKEEVEMTKPLVVPLAVIFILVFCSTALAGFGAGGNLFLSLPQEDFANVSQNGGGFGAKFFFSPPLMPVFAVRADLAFAVYGSETSQEEVADIVVDVETRNQSIQFTVGPQFQSPMGPLRIYGAPMVGVYNYSTEVEIPDTEYGRTENSTTKFGWNFSGGMLVKVYSSPMGKFDLDIDLGGKYHTIKNAIETEIAGETVTSDANDISIHVGILVDF